MSSIPSSPSEIGHLQQWNDERGFGYILPQDGSGKLFVHISAFAPKPAADQRPQVGQRLQFKRERHEGRWRATQVRWQTVAAGRSAPSEPLLKAKPGAERRSAPRPGGKVSGAAVWRYGAIAGLTLLLGYLYIIGQVQAQLPLVYVVMSLLTFGIYWKDKTAAQSGRWRTPENTLHLLALLGGWPGALLAQQWLRHKSAKTGFLLVSVLTMVFNVAGLWLLAGRATGTAGLSNCGPARDWFCQIGGMLVR